MPVKTVESNEYALPPQVLARDADAFAQWMTRNDRWVRGVIYGVLGRQDRIDDVAQQVWMAAWQRLDTLRDRQSWRTWLYAIARHAALDAGRDATRRKRNQAGPVADEPVDPRSPSPQRSVAEEERRATVMRAIESLPALYREPFVLRHLEGWSYRQIAELMDMPVDSVETRLVRAMRMVRDALKDQDLLGP